MRTRWAGKKCPHLSRQDDSSWHRVDRICRAPFPPTQSWRGWAAGRGPGTKCGHLNFGFGGEGCEAIASCRCGCYHATVSRRPGCGHFLSGHRPGYMCYVSFSVAVLACVRDFSICVGACICFEHDAQSDDDVCVYGTTPRPQCHRGTTHGTTQWTTTGQSAGQPPGQPWDDPRHSHGTTPMATTRKGFGPAAVRLKSRVPPTPGSTAKNLSRRRIPRVISA